MKNILLISMFLLCAVAARAQNQSFPAAPLNGTGAPSGTCGNGVLYTDNVTGNIYSCIGNAWTTIFTSGNTFTGSNEISKLNGTIYIDTDNDGGWVGADACAWMNSAIASLPTVAGYPVGVIDITGLASTTKVTCGSTVFVGSPYLWVRGPGSASLIFNCTGTGDCFNSQTGHFNGSPQPTKGFRASGFSLLGQGTGNANAGGWHYGDMCDGRLDDIQISNFAGTNGFGLWLENTLLFSENNLFVNVVLGETPGDQSGNTKNLRFSVNASGGAQQASFSRTNIINMKFSTNANQTAIAMDGGSVYNQSWWMNGNTNSATGSTFIEMSGTTYPSSGQDTFFSGYANIQVECTGCSGAQFYNVPSGYAFVNNYGQVSGGSGFNYGTGLSGTVLQYLNPSPITKTAFIAYNGSTGATGNEYDLVPVNPGSSRTISIRDPGFNGTIGMTGNTSSGVYEALPGTSGCTTGASAGNACASAMTVTWPTAFGDANYSAGCTPVGAPTNFPGSPYVVVKSAGSMTVNYIAITAAAASWPTIDCWAIHN